ncbi:AAA family ATPase [Kallotenue papyrolyticum]|uniref:AAA family ATPase n=1 Tax=Kallotenue papyrolyticum TaxID=1325125 RepID=UPI0004785F2A|nr:AAA family ATPase [Kallotenue papyrolyticum]
MATHNRSSVIRVVVVAPAEAIDQEWIRALEADPEIALVASMGVLQRGIDAVREHQPHVLVIDRPLDQVEQLIQAAAAVAPQTLCVAILPQQDMAAVRRLVAAGARDILAKPLNQRELVASLRQVVQNEEHRRRRVGLPSLLAPVARPTNGKLVVVMGPKGGVGATTVATNLAVALRQVSGAEVALADVCLQFGDVAVLLNLWSRHTLHDLAVHHQNIDDALLDRVLVPHASGVRVLLAPGEPELTADIGAAQITAIIKALRQRFAFVVVDCWSVLDEVTETLINLADQVLLVTTPEVPALKDTKQALEYFQRHGVHREHIVLVLNRFPSVKGVTLQDIQQHLRHPIQANLPSDGPAVTYAANKGVPVLLSHPQSWVAQSFRKLAAWIAGDQVETISLPATESAAGLASQPATQRAPRWRLGLRKSGH